MIKGISGAPIFFILMPYIGISILPSDVQPFALVLSILSLIFYKGVVKVDKISIVLLVMLLISIISFIVNIYNPYQDMMFDSRALFGYATAPIIYLYFYNYLLSNESNSLVKYIDIAVLIVFFGFILNIFGFTQIIQIFVNRAIFDESTAGARGLTSFFPEQSRIPTQAIFFAFFYLMAGRLNWYRGLALLLMSAFSASGQFFINISVFVVSMGIAVLYGAVRNGRFRALHLTYAIFGFALLTGIVFITRSYHLSLIEIGLPRRGIEAFYNISGFEFDFISNDMGFLYKISGPLQGISAIIFDPFKIQIGTAYYFEFERGLLAIYTNLIYDLFSSNLVPLPSRSYSIFGAWWTDFRIYGLIITVAFVVLLRGRSEVSRSNIFIGIYAVLIFLFLFRSNTSDPTPWAAAAAFAYAGRPWPRREG